MVPAQTALLQIRNVVFIEFSFVNKVASESMANNCKNMCTVVKSAHLFKGQGFSSDQHVYTLGLLVGYVDFKCSLSFYIY